MRYRADVRIAVVAISDVASFYSSVMRKTTNTGHFHEWASAASQLGVCLSVCVAVEWNGFPSPFSSLSDENRITRRWRTTASRWYLWCIHSLLAGLCASPWSFGLLFHADIAARVLPFVLSMRPPHFRQCTYPASLYPHVDALVVPTCKSSDPQNGQGKGRTVDGANTAPSTLCSGFMRPPSGLCSSSWCSQEYQPSLLATDSPWQRQATGRGVFVPPW